MQLGAMYPVAVTRKRRRGSVFLSRRYLSLLPLGVVVSEFSREFAEVDMAVKFAMQKIYTH